MNIRLAVALALPFASLSAAHAIVIRHDRDDAKYQRLAQRYKAPVCQTATGGQGTLIAKNWVITAAHVVEEVGPFDRYVLFGEKKVGIKALYLHPSWGGPERANDIALIELDQPVENITPVKLYDKSDEAGKKIIFVGTGMTGDGNTGPQRDDNVWRAAENVITSAEPTRIRFKFDAPPAGSDLEGISGPGDSGGPALLQKGRDLYILGTSSTNSSPNREKTCTYGTIESYGRVSTTIDWIHSVMKGKVKPLVDKWPSPTRGEPTGEAGKKAMEYFNAMNGPDAKAYVAFARKHLAPKALEGLTDEDLLARAQRSQADFGTYTILESSEVPGSVSVLARSSKRGLLSMTFFFDAEGKYLGLRRSPVPG